MLPENRDFWIRGDDGVEYGPVDLNELREWVRENRVGLGTAVRADDTSAPWHHWQHYPELIALLAESQAGKSRSGGTSGQVIAPLLRRVLAFIMDFILSAILASPMLITMALVFRPAWFVQFALASVDPSHFSVTPMPMHDEVVGSLISNTVLALYMGGFHALHGRTPGKSLMRLEVVDENGDKPSLVKCLIRAVLLIFSLNFYGLPLLYIFFNPQRRTFHDFVAGTCVVQT